MLAEIAIDRCVSDSVRIFCGTPKSATYRQHAKPTTKKITAEKRVGRQNSPSPSELGNLGEGELVRKALKKYIFTSVEILPTVVTHSNAVCVVKPKKVSLKGLSLTPTLIPYKKTITLSCNRRTKINFIFLN